MKKNKAMRLASALLVLTLLTTCAISSTFAKYVTKAEGTDKARVAKWGFEGGSTIAITDLFKTAYDKNVQGAADVIAPGTTNSATFGFTYGGAAGATAPEVAYTFTVSTDGSTCERSIKDNPNIQWKLDGGDWSSWDDLLNAINALSGDMSGTNTYNPGQLPEAFKTAGTHTVSWRWLFDETTPIEGGTVQNNDATDTAMGNATDLADVTLKITVAATQLD